MTTEGTGTGGAMPEDAPPGRTLRVREHALVSCFWLAYNFQWAALLAIVLPSQIAALVGDAHKELWNGAILSVGAVLSLVVTPLAGAISDRSRSRFGRRRPFLLVGTAVNALFLLVIAGFGAGGSVGLFLLGYLGVQWGSNWAGGPYAGLIPDIIPPDQRGAASGWLAFMSALGTLSGAIAAGMLIHGQTYGAIYAAIVAVLLLALAATLAGVRERRLPDCPPRISVRDFLGSFILRGPEYRDFYLVLLTRGLVTMGIYSVFTFFEFFLKDILRVADPVRETSYLIAIIIGAGIPTSLIAGRLSDRHGRKPLVYLSGGLMALASIVFIAVGIFPSLPFVFAVGAVFGIGYGAYQAVDWALAVDVLPRSDAAAKDMGIWHVSLVLPQVLAPALTGATLTAFKGVSLLTGYAVVFVLTAVWFALGTVFVRRIRGAR